MRVAELLLEQNKETEVEGRRGRRGKKIDGGFNVLLSFFPFIPGGKQSNLMNIFIQVGWLNHQLTRPTKAFFYQLKKDLIWLCYLGFKAMSFLFSVFKCCRFVLYTCSETKLPQMVGKPDLDIGETRVWF